MADAKHYDVLVIGAGQAGGPLAGAFAKSGKRVAIVERGPVGGSCVNYGCTPTKTMIASGDVAHMVRRAKDYGIDAGEPRVNMQVILRRKREMVEKSRKGAEHGLTSNDNIDLLRGHARFVGPRRAEVDLRDAEPVVIEADTVILDVGQSPRVPELDGIGDTPFLDSTSVMELAEVPRHLLVLGGGYVGLEFAQLFRRLGGMVTIIQDKEQLLPKEDADVADALREALSDEGIDIRLSAEASAVEKLDDGVGLTASVDGKKQRFEGSHLLIAAGRVPNTDDLGLDAAGIDRDERGYIRVDERLATSAEGVYAAGDAAGSPPFTHIAYHDYRIIKANLLGEGGMTTRDRLVCYTVFTDPQLGRVGLTERQARAAGHDVAVASMPAAKAGRAVEIDKTHGLLKAVIDRQTEQILGAAMLVHEGGELVGTLQAAMFGQVPYTRLRDAPLSHPTLVESLNNLFSQIDA